MSLDIKSSFVSVRNLLTGSLIWLLVLGGALILLVDEPTLVASMSGRSGVAVTADAPEVDTTFMPVSEEQSAVTESEVASQTRSEPASTQPQAPIKQEESGTSNTQTVTVPEENDASPVQTAALSPQAVATAKKGGWYIQIGVFSSSKNAEHLRALANISGWNVAVQSVSDGNKTSTKLLIGPYKTKQAANGVKGEVRKDLKTADMFVTQANL